MSLNMLKKAVLTMPGFSICCAQLTFTCSKSTTETLEKGVK